ncbi:MAG: hypothetical protein KUG68_12395 [Flavobacteriaceae bacterium]|nr:hypothetical protein [Flavobacteriaceae bacterium]
MKKLKIILIFIGVLFFSFNQMIAQEASASQAFWVHEDPIFPPMAADYEGYCTDLAVNCKKYDIKDASWFTISTDDLKYFHISPIENMGDLDKNRFFNLRQKMGDEEFDKLFEGFDSCYDTHSDYIIHLDNDLSYVTDGKHEGHDFRKLEFWYVTPQNFDKIIRLAKSFKELYSKNNSKEHYNLYRSGFGSSGDFVLVEITAESAESYEKIRKENKELLGEERNVIYQELLGLITKVETLTGYMRMDLSYFPEK